jgi:peptidoglycan hydrolase-like protein with peptidoglycan-binding domain
MSNFKALHRISRKSAAKAGDVSELKRILNDLGIYDGAQHGIDAIPNEPLFQAIEAFQRASGLAVDGAIDPEGETQEALNKAYGKVRTPILRCIVCGAPHGGSQGALCPDCAKKLNS